MRRPIKASLGTPPIWRGYVAALCFLAVAMLVGTLFRRLPHANLSLLFLLAVLLVAARFGLGPAIFASLLGFVALNFFFTEPYFTLAVEQQSDVATLVFFLAMAGLTANLASRARAEMASNRAALARVSTLLDFSRTLAAAGDAERALQALADHARAIVAARAVALMPGADGRLRIAAASASPTGPEPPVEELDVAWKAGVGPRHMAGWTCLPLATARAPLGMLALAAGEIRHAQRELLDALCEQAAVAIERIELVDHLRAAQVHSEREQLRSALLASVSHDLRTPLASIVGSATSLLEYGAHLEAHDRAELLGTVRDESLRLDRYIQNLLDMTRFGQDAFEPQRQWAALHDLVGGALRRLGSRLERQSIGVEIDPQVAVLHVHGALIEQALVNLLDNAADFAPVGSKITVRAYPAGDATVLDVADRGPGIPDAERDKIFDMFHRASQGDRRHHGVGLGLAICRSIVTAHGGSIEALPQDGGGTCMRIALPFAANPAGDARA